MIRTTHLPKNPLKTVIGITSFTSCGGCSIICSCFFCAGDGPSSLKEEEDKVRVVGLIPLIVLCVGDDIMKAFKLPIIEKIRANHAGYRYIICCSGGYLWGIEERQESIGRSCFVACDY